MGGDAAGYSGKSKVSALKAQGGPMASIGKPAAPAAPTSGINPAFMIGMPAAPLAPAAPTWDSSADDLNNAADQQRRPRGAAATIFAGYNGGGSAGPSVRPMLGV